MDAAKLLVAVADRLQQQKSGRDFGEMTPEDAYSDALTAVSIAIREAVEKLKGPSVE